MTLEELLAGNRPLLVQRWQARTAQRASAGRARNAKSSLAPFLDALLATFGSGQAAHPAADAAAGLHGRAMHEQGFTIEDVVHDYGDLRQAIVGLALQLEAPVSVSELAALGRRLDDGVAVAVGEFVSQQLAGIDAEHTEDINQRLGVFAHGLRNHITTATLAVHISRTGTAGLSGPSGQILDRSLKGLAQLIDRSLAEALMAHETVVEPELFPLAEFIDDVQASASLEANAAQCSFIVAPVAAGLAVRGDRDLLLAAAGSLLQNAFKFTRRSTDVHLKAYAVGERIHIDIEDNCGGLPPGGLERVFLPYGLRRGDQAGVGLGLSISRRSVEANEGTLTVRDVPGVGCVFTIDLPKHADPSTPT